MTTKASSTTNHPSRRRLQPIPTFPEGERSPQRRPRPVRRTQPRNQLPPTSRRPNQSPPRRTTPRPETSPSNQNWNRRPEMPPNLRTTVGQIRRLSGSRLPRKQGKALSDNAVGPTAENSQSRGAYPIGIPRNGYLRRKVRQIRGQVESLELFTSGIPDVLSAILPLATEGCIPIWNKATYDEAIRRTSGQPIRPNTDTRPF